MESVICIDILRRAKIDVTVVGLDDSVVTCSREVKIKADKTIADVKRVLFDVVVLPGGLEGADNLCKSAEVGEVLRNHYKIGNLIAAICAAPTALAAHDIGKGKRVTSYPTMKDKLRDYTYSEKRVERDGNILTSRSPGTAFEFAFEMVNILMGQPVVDKLKKEMLCL